MGEYKNPWLGLESYQEHQTMYGRNVEIAELYQYVVNNKETLLFGKSGVGKSSIINAGILPVVRRQGYVPVVVRLDHSNQQPYVLQLSGQIKEAVAVSDCTITKPTDQQLLWEYFHTHRFCNKTTGEPCKLLVIFDQFEEIFTLQKKVGERKNFFKELRDVLNNVMPREVADEEQSSDNESPKTTEKKVISGFSDIEAFFDDIDDVATNPANKYIDDNVVHFIFTIREDSLSEFEYYTAKIPTLKQHRYYLRPLNEEQAREIIMNPCPGLVSLDVAKLIIAKIVGTSDFELDGEPEIDVEATLLSLYMNRYYEGMVADNASVISADLVNKAGEVIIQRFYEDSIAFLSQEKQESLGQIFLTPDGRRDNKSYSYVKPKYLTEEEIRKLVDEKHLLHEFPMHGDQRLELMHDVLCPVVVEHQKQIARQLEFKKSYKRYSIIYVVELIFICGLIWLTDWHTRLTEQEQRLHALESSVTNYTVNAKLDNQEVFGALQIVVNAIDNNEEDETAAKSVALEQLLRKVYARMTDSLPQCLAKKYVEGTNADVCAEFLLSRDGRWMAFNENSAILSVYDAHTLNEAIVYEPYYSCSLRITDFSAVQSHPEYGEYAECLTVVDDSVLLAVSFGTAPEERMPQGKPFGTRIQISQTEKIEDAYFANNDSLIVLVHPHGISLWDAASGIMSANQEAHFSPCSIERYRNDSVTMGLRTYYSRPGGEIEMVLQESCAENPDMDYDDLLAQCKALLGPFWKYSYINKLLNFLKN